MNINDVAKEIGEMIAKEAVNMIDPEATVEALWALLDKYDENLEHQVCGDAATLIDLLRGQLAERDKEIERLREAQRWIEAEDRLPDIGNVCLCRIEHNYTDDGWSAYRVYEYGGEGYWLTMGNLCFVTHWLPLPEPPECYREGGCR